MKPKLDASLDAEGCRGCHTPEEIENPGFTETRRMIAPVAVSGKYVDIKFSHIAHFKEKLAVERDADKRRILKELLAKEEQKLRDGAGADNRDRSQSGDF